MAEIILKGHRVSKGRAEGQALVTRMPISFFGGVNPETGLVADKGHELYGQSLSGKILIFPQEKGSSGGSYQIYEMLCCKTAPAGMINLSAGSIVAVGAIMSNIPMMDHVDPDPFTAIRTGDYVVIDADAETIRVTKP